MENETPLNTSLEEEPVAEEISESSKYCTGCGTEVKKEWAYCSGCGTKIGE